MSMRGVVRLFCFLGTSGAHFAPFLDARDVKIVASFVDNLYRLVGRS